MIRFSLLGIVVAALSVCHADQQLAPDLLLTEVNVTENPTILGRGLYYTFVGRVENVGGELLSEPSILLVLRSQGAIVDNLYAPLQTTSPEGLAPGAAGVFRAESFNGHYTYDEMSYLVYGNLPSPPVDFSAEDRLDGDLTLISAALSPNQLGYARVMGEVKNTTNADIRLTGAHINLYDHSDVFIGTADSWYTGKRVRPGETDFFAAHTPHLLSSVARFEFVAWDYTVLYIHEETAVLTTSWAALKSRLD